MSPPTRTPFNLGPWRVEPLLHQLVHSGETPRHITPKTMEVLLYLVDHAGQVVTRDALLEAVWPETHIREEVITRAISDLRSALEDDRRAPRFIETIPKVGYRLIAEVTPSSLGASHLGSKTTRPGGVTPSIVNPEALQPSVLTPSADAAPTRPAPRGWLPILVGAVLATVLIGLGMSLNSGRGVQSSDVQSSDVQPADISATAPVPSAPVPSAPVPTAPFPSTRPLGASPVTNFPGFESYAEIAPDGRHVAYSWNGEEETFDIYISASTGGHPRRLTTDPAADAGATWSPDGLRIAFGRYSPGQDGEKTCTLMEVPVQGGPERRLGPCGKNGTADFAWSPSGEWIAFSDRREGDKTFGIYLLSTLTGESHLLVSPDDQHWGDREPSFSPDGGQVAFIRSVSMATQDVFRISTTGGQPVPVTRDGRSLRGLAWFPDGGALVVSSRRTGARGLWRFPLDGGAPSWLPIAVDHAWNPTLGRTAGPMLFEYRVLEAGIQQLILSQTLSQRNSPGASTPWLVSTREDLEPQYSPDGQRVAFASNRSGHFELWSAPADGAAPVQLTALSGAYAGSPRWSPEGRSIVFDARLDGQADIYRVVPNETPERLTVHPANDLGASYSADGRWIFFGSNRTGEWQIWRRPSGGGEPEQVTANGGYQALLSADGETLFFTRFHRNGLFRLALGNGTSLPLPGGESVPETENLIGHNHWTLVGDTVYWLSSADEKVTLKRLRPTGEQNRLADLGSKNLMPGLSVTADERRVLYTELTRLEADLWRVDETIFPNFNHL